MSIQINGIHEDRDGILYRKGSDTLYTYLFKRISSAVTVSGTEIAGGAFCSNSYVTDVTTAEGMEQIEGSAFAGSDITILAPAGSYTADWAQSRSIPCVEE